MLIGLCRLLSKLATDVAGVGTTAVAEVDAPVLGPLCVVAVLSLLPVVRREGVVRPAKNEPAP